MKNCLKHNDGMCTCALSEKLASIIGDEVVGFFERRLATSYQEVRVFTPVYASKKSRSVVN